MKFPRLTQQPNGKSLGDPRYVRSATFASRMEFLDLAAEWVPTNKQTWRMNMPRTHTHMYIPSFFPQTSTNQAPGGELRINRPQDWFTIGPRRLKTIKITKHTCFCFQLRYFIGRSWSLGGFFIKYNSSKKSFDFWEAAFFLNIMLDKHDPETWERFNAILDGFQTHSLNYIDFTTNERPRAHVCKMSTHLTPGSSEESAGKVAFGNWGLETNWLGVTTLYWGSGPLNHPLFDGRAVARNIVLRTNPLQQNTSPAGLWEQMLGIRWRL